MIGSSAWRIASLLIAAAIAFGACGYVPGLPSGNEVRPPTPPPIQLP